MRTWITSQDSLNSLVDNVERNVCPNCGKEFIIVALALRGSSKGGKFWFEVFNISEEVWCPDCSPSEKEKEN